MWNEPSRLDKEFIMTTKEISVLELQKLDPKRFEREYWDWVSHHWWEGDDTIDWFVSEQTSKGILDIDPKDVTYSGFYSQGDGAAFDARVDVLRFMRDKGYDNTYMPLYMDMENYGVSCKVSRGSYRANYMAQGADIDYTPGNCLPAGIFSDMSQEAWDTLLEEQWGYLENELTTEIHEYAKDAADELYTALSDDYDASTSEEEFIESCECNGVTFEIEEEESCEA
jgi:hypothetical protein